MSIYDRMRKPSGTPYRRTISPSQRTVIPRGTVLTRMPSRTADLLNRSRVEGPARLFMPGMGGGSHPLFNPPAGSHPLRPTIRRLPTGGRAPLNATPAPGGSGLLPASVDGGLSTQLGNMGTSLTSFGGNIATQAQNLAPVAIKIGVGLIILKVVLWLIRGRKR